jgi:hypothetical protein
MKIPVAATILSLLLLQPLLYAQEKEPLRFITGELSAYGNSAVVVDGERIELCDDFEVLDTLEKPIRIDGLVATEIVTVTVRKACAIEVKAEKIRR